MRVMFVGFIKYGLSNCWDGTKQMVFIHPKSIKNRQILVLGYMLGQVQAASRVLIRLCMSGPLRMTFVMGGNSRAGSHANYSFFPL